MFDRIRERLTIAAIAASITACGGGLSDARHPTGSGQMVTSSDYRALYIASTDHGAVTRFDTETSATTAVDVGVEPVRIARAKALVFVTLYGERAVAVLQETAGSLEVVQKIAVGAEPFGVVAQESGERVFVAVSLSNEVVAIDTETLEVSDTWSVPDQPRWLALHPNGRDLYVASALNGTLSHIDTERGEVERVPLPRVRGRATHIRVLGDPAISSDGYYIAVPTMNLDPTTPIDDSGTAPPIGYYGGRQDFTVALIPVSGGDPDTAKSRIIALSNGAPGVPVGAPTSVQFDPSGFELYVALEGRRRIAVIDIEGEKGASGGLFSARVEGPDGPMPLVPAEPRRVSFALVPEGPRAVAFLDDNRAYVYGFLDRAVAELDRTNAVVRAGEGSVVAPTIGDPVAIAEPAFDEDVERGRRLFYTSNDERISSPLTGLSCSTCHLDGRSDGISWTFVRGARQTPSLAGEVSLTAPVRWEGDRETVAIDAQRTSRDAMGGTEMSDEQAALIERFIDSTRDADVPLNGSSDAAVARGRAIFERADVGCASCHVGARKTDNQSYEMFGLLVQTRSLIGVASSPPYLHDGSAPTLRDVVLRSRSGEMGDTSKLSEQEIDDLVMYLSSL